MPGPNPSPSKADKQSQPLMTVYSRVITSHPVLTHQVFVIIEVSIVDDAMSVPLVEPTQTTHPKPFAVNRRPALKARLSQALVQTLAQGSAGDFRVVLSPEPGIAEPLEGGIGSPAVSEEVGRERVVGELSPRCCRKKKTQ